MTLTPTQCADLAKFAGWTSRETYGQVHMASYKRIEYYGSLSTVLMAVIAEQKCPIEQSHITEAGAFDLLRAVRDSLTPPNDTGGRNYKVPACTDIVKVILQYLGGQDIDLPTAIGLAVVQAIEEGK